MGPTDPAWYDSQCDIETIGDEEGDFHYPTEKEAEKEVKRLIEIQPIRHPPLRFRVVETITNVNDWNYKGKNEIRIQRID